ncbi:hypothetical protein [Listeria cornellensis]|nr:hypothetical protein [Listeria cornellensis]
MDDQILKLGMIVSEIAVKNSAEVVFEQIRSIKGRKMISKQLLN